MDKQILDFSNIIQYSFPTKILFGQGARRLLPKNLKELNAKNILLITDRVMYSMPQSPVAEMKKLLEDEGLKVNVFSEVWGNPTESQVKGGVEVFKASRTDSVVALGGGAVIDVAKAIILMGTHSGNLFDYEDGLPTAPPIQEKLLPYFVALPTTSGTGSEVGRSTVISDDKTHVKKIIFSPALLAKAVYADPELTLKLPLGVTASTGMDALTHCIESYLAKGFHPICDGIALEGMALVAKSLERCVEFAKAGGVEKLSEEALKEQIYYRGLMLNASMMGAIAFQKGLGVNHSCAHALSTVCDMHHGLANGIMLPYSMRFNAKTETQRFALMAQRVGLVASSAEKLVEEFHNWLVSLKKNIGIPSTLGEAGVKKEHIKDLVEFAYQDGCHHSNPVLVSKEDFIKIFERAL